MEENKVWDFCLCLQKRLNFGWFNSANNKEKVSILGDQQILYMHMLKDLLFFACSEHIVVLVAAFLSPFHWRDVF